jgi:hypothetical protein
MSSFLAQLFAPSNNQTSTSTTKTTNVSDIDIQILRTDIYKCISSASDWLSSNAGDGLSYRPIFEIVTHYFPLTTINLPGSVSEEVPPIVGAICNMILEYGKKEGMAGAMAMESWVNKLIKVIEGPRGKEVGEAIALGVNQKCDASLVTKEFAPKVQMIKNLKKSGFLPFFLGIRWMLMRIVNSFAQGLRREKYGHCESCGSVGFSFDVLDESLTTLFFFGFHLVYLYSCFVVPSSACNS